MLPVGGVKHYLFFDPHLRHYKLTISQCLLSIIDKPWTTLTEALFYGGHSHSSNICAISLHTVHWYYHKGNSESLCKPITASLSIWHTRLDFVLPVIFHRRNTVRDLNHGRVKVYQNITWWMTWCENNWLDSIINCKGSLNWTVPLTMHNRNSCMFGFWISTFKKIWKCIRYQTGGRKQY